VSPIDYLDFDLEIERAAQDYRAEINCPAGQSSCAFSLPFSDLELENFLLRIGHSGRGMRRIDSPEIQAAKAFGSRLFNAVFADEFRACLRSSLEEAEQQGKGLRIRLRLNDVPELADLPWEYLYNPALNRFLVLSNKTPLVRYLELPERIRPLALTPPLRMLVMIASPSNYPPLNVEREWDKLRAALQALEERGLVTLERVEPSLAALQQQLRRNTYHILHFMGHGGFDERSQDGVLLLEDEDRLGDRVSGQDLVTLLHDHSSLRLAVLNACEGARASRTDPFAGTAQSLVQQGVPAVIAMQFEVSDEVAVTLAREFYGAIADGYPSDAALAEARKAIFAAGNSVEWGTPVLYLRAPEGKIFYIAPVSAPDPKSPTPVAPLISPIQPAPVTVRSAGDAATPAAQPAPLGRHPGTVGVAIGVVVLLALLAVLFLGRDRAPGDPDPKPTANSVTLGSTSSPAPTAPLPTITDPPTSVPVSVATVVAPTDRPTNLPTPVPSSATPQAATPVPSECALPLPNGGFGIVLRQHDDIRRLLGCPESRPIEAAGMAEQPFKSGIMLFTPPDIRNQSGQIYVIQGSGDTGQWQAYDDTFTSSDPEPTPQIFSNGFYVVRGFGKVYREQRGVATGLGNPLDFEASIGGVRQRFVGGTMLYTPTNYAGSNRGTIYVLFNRGDFERLPEPAP
jgi:hypothetical protein